MYLGFSSLAESVEVHVLRLPFLFPLNGKYGEVFHTYKSVSGCLTYASESLPGCLFFKSISKRIRC
jgi:hypothetical protein